MESQPKEKIGVIGLGPVGMILASKLKQAGCELYLCERNRVKLNKIKSEGIVLTNVFDSNLHFDRLYESIEELASADLDYLIIAVKTYQLNAITKSLSVFNTGKLNVIVAQNGIDVEEILEPVFGDSKILRMILNFAGNLSSSNTVRVSFFNPPNYISSINDSKPDAALRIAELLTEAGLSTKAVDSFEILKRTWEKTILNSSLSALCGVGKLTMAEAMSDPDTVELIEQIINEAVQVAEHEKIRFPDDFIRQCMRYLKKGGDHFPSLALDIINNRQTEIDYFNGKIVEYGRKHYVKTSLNLSFTNMVKAMTNKNLVYRVPGPTGEVSRKIMEKGLLPGATMIPAADYFLGIDLGSAFSKFTVIDSEAKPVFQYYLPTISNDGQALKNVMQTIVSNYNIKYSCATGYGRKHFADADIIKTEINCAAVAVSNLHPGAKNIIDIGGEDIKVIRCDENGLVANFYMNDKCAAGTGSFLTEIADRAKLIVSEMSSLASMSDYDKELNSFCTVFAKTEIMNWIFDGMPPHDIARGIYISIANKVAKMRLEPGVPVFMVGGVIKHHPFLKNILEEKFKLHITTVDQPQFIVSYGAAIFARQSYRPVVANNKNLASQQV